MVAAVHVSSSREAVEWRLRAPDNLLMELRICARAGNRSVNEEIIAAFIVAELPAGKPVIKMRRVSVSLHWR